MRRLLVALLAGPALLAAAPAASALSCVGHPDLTPGRLVDGTAVRGDGTPLLVGFDGVLLCRVVDVVRDGPPPGADVVPGGAVRVELRVLRASAAVPDRVAVSGSEAAWGMWQPFEPGGTYVVAFRRHPHDPARVLSELCEPVLAVRAPDLGPLLALADGQGWPTPDPAPAPADGPAPPRPATPLATATGTATATATGTATTTAGWLLGGAALAGAAAAGSRGRQRPPRR